MSQTKTQVDRDEAAVSLLVVEDRPIIRRGLALMLETEPGVRVVGQAADGAQALALAQALRPDVVLMDLRMPVMDGVTATRLISERLPGTRVVVLTTFDDDELVFEAVQAGAHAYLLKDASEAELLETVRAVHRGESRLSPTVARKVLEQFRGLASAAAADGAWRAAEAAAADAPPAGASAPWTAAGTALGAAAGVRRSDAPAGAPAGARQALADEPLSEKEQRVLGLLCEGLSNREIAARIFLAEGTVKNYVSRIMEKLHARSRIELALRAKGRNP